MHGLLRVRGFTQDDAHLFMTREQLPGELERVVNFCLYILRTFGFTEFKLYLATQPEGLDRRSRDVGRSPRPRCSTCCKKSGLPYEIDPGGGAFYGPKIDLKLKDAIGREWQCSTVQVDFNLPEKFDLQYVGADGAKHRVVMVHRALLGSIERFFGVLTEHYVGAFPVWLAPIQARVIAVGDNQEAFVNEVAETLQRRGFRVDTHTGRREARREDPPGPAREDPVHARVRRQGGRGPRGRGAPARRHPAARDADRGVRRSPRRRGGGAAGRRGELVKVLTPAELEADPKRLGEVVSVLAEGGLACFPVRGTYRIAADLRSEAAILRLMQSKRRAANHPALIFVPDLDGAKGVVAGTSWPNTRRLAERFWPKPLTLVLPPGDDLPPKVRRILSKATGKLGVRMPGDPLAEQILRAFGGPLLVSSANLERKPGASSASVVRQRFLGTVDVWIDAGDTRPDAQSTLVELGEASWKIVREGAITRDELERALA